MGGVRQAVLDFDAAVRVPWRPLLDGATGDARPAGRPARGASRTALPGSGLRVTGHLRPVPDLPAPEAVRTAGPPAEAPRARRDPARPGGRPVRSGPVRGGVRRAPAPAPVRLTRRGRRLVVALVLAAGVGGAALGREFLAPDPGLHLAGESSVVVEQGDTVWSIAGEVAGPGQDVRAVVDAIQELNDLEGSALVAGQVLRLP
ncbi:LysM peptidoglycan-binding domain-containing protein [Geodermatophilus amargosae]|uniref:LysM peptidoglycan-binding domain-containing protein n=1 Tax=Geodermatophilus amargosae TaxID=1296565 RepID=UPI0034DE63A1